MEQQIDLSRYRTQELVERLGGLLSIRSSLRRVVLTTFLASIPVAILLSLILNDTELAAMAWWIACAVALLLGLTIGFLLGLVRVCEVAVNQVEGILQMILEIVEQVAADHEALQAREAELPSGSELLEKVYREVFLPALEQAVRAALGPLGAPLLWVYRSTLGWAVSYLISAAVKQRVDDPQDKAELEDTARELGQQLSPSGRQIHAFVKWSYGFVAATGRRLRSYVVLPLYVAWFACLLVATVPFFVLRWLFSGDVQD